jgi:hypothetical protein
MRLQRLQRSRYDGIRSDVAAHGIERNSDSSAHDVSEQRIV